MATKAKTAEPPTTNSTMRVEATRMGYINNERKRPGDIFDIQERQFSERWMERVSGTTPTTTSNTLTALQRQLTKLNNQERQTGAAEPVSSDESEVI